MESDSKRSEGKDTINYIKYTINQRNRISHLQKNSWEYYEKNFSKDKFYFSEGEVSPLIPLVNFGITAIISLFKMH